MTTGEEGITSDLTVEFCGSGGAEEEVSWTDAEGASTVASAAAAWLLLTEALVEGPTPF